MRTTAMSRARACPDLAEAALARSIPARNEPPKTRIAPSTTNASGTTSPPNSRLDEIDGPDAVSAARRTTPASRRRRPTDMRTAAMNRNAIPRLSVPRPSWLMPDVAERVRHRERRDDRARHTASPSRARWPSLTRKASPMASTSTRAERARLRVQLLEQQQPAEDQQEDADPRQARAGAPGPSPAAGAPFPAVDPHVWLARTPATTVGAEPRHLSRVGRPCVRCRRTRRRGRRCRRGGRGLVLDVAEAESIGAVGRAVRAPTSSSDP